MDDECDWNENWINLTLLEVLPVRLNYVPPSGVHQSLDEEYRVKAHLDDNCAYVEALTLWQERAEKEMHEATEKVDTAHSVEGLWIDVIQV